MTKLATGARGGHPMRVRRAPEVCGRGSFIQAATAATAMHELVNNVKHGESCDYLLLLLLPSYLFPRLHRRKDEERTQVCGPDRACRGFRGRPDDHIGNRRLSESWSGRVHLLWHQKQK